MSEKYFKTLKDLLRSIPGINSSINFGISDKNKWWIKFIIDIEDDLSWSIVQEFGCICNYISVSERLPTVFYPVSPAPYLNGGPDEFLSWIIEGNGDEISPTELSNWLENRLPQPIFDRESWKN